MAGPRTFDRYSPVSSSWVAILIQIVGAVINVDGVAAGVCRLQRMFWVCPTVHDSPPLGVWSVIYGLRCTVKLASLRSVIDRLRCNKIFTLPRVVG